MVDIAGEPHLLTSVRDISARKRSEAELHHSRLALIEHNESLRLINHLAQRLHGSLNLEEILHETIQALLGLSKAPHVAIYLVVADLTQLHLAASHGFPPSLMKLGSTLPMQGSLTGLALSQGNMLEIDDNQQR